MSIYNEWALILSGGGAKGSYQIGVWQRLIEENWIDKITAVSGSSVGALNAALFLQGDINSAKEMWLDVTQEDIVTVNTASFKKILKDFFSLKDYEEAEILYDKLSKFKTDEFLSFINKGKIKTTIESNVDQQKLLNQNKKLYVTASDVHTDNVDLFIVNSIIDFLKSEHFGGYDNLYNHCIDSLKSISSPVYFDVLEARFKTSDILMASAAFPIAFDSVNINNLNYIDGGFIDNTPIKPLYDLGYRRFICVYLKTSPNDYREFDNCEFINIVPSNENFDKFKSTLIVNRKNIEKQMTDGYNDSEKLVYINK